MNTMQVNSYFDKNPVSIDIPRSTISVEKNHSTTWDTGELIPILCTPILPGDSLKLSLASVVRLQTLIKPPIDSLYLDVFAFFVPDRLAWSHFKEFMGENTQSAWIQQGTYSIPQIVPPSGGWDFGTIADHLGIPPALDNISVSAIPFRDYALIVDEFFRSSAVQDPVLVNLGDSTTSGSNGSNYVQDLEKGGKPFIVNRYFDAYSGALPSPQRGPTVRIPTGTSDLYPVITTADRVDKTLFPMSSNRAYGVHPILVNTMEPGYANNYYYNAWQAGSSGAGTITPYQDSTTSKDPTNATQAITFDNLWAVGAGQLGASINELRTAFAIQRYYEKLARGGDRMTEILQSFFGVRSPDARLQRPEYIGGYRRMINVNQVVQQSSTDNTSPQGNITATSLTTDNEFLFDRSFVEPGYVFVLISTRYKAVYQQGIPRDFRKTTKFERYWPPFANLSETGIKNSELYAQGSTAIDSDTGKPYDDEIFGYQEAWYEYRYFPNTLSNQLRSSYAQSLDSWHFADNYASMPYLSSDWLQVDKTNVDRALAVTSQISNQWLGDFNFNMRWTRPMPLYSVPGLIDHQ